LQETTSDHLAAFATKKKMAAKEREKKEFEELQESKENMLCKVMVRWLRFCFRLLIAFILKNLVNSLRTALNSYRFASQSRMASSPAGT
jgi:hypothetical protein